MFLLFFFFFYCIFPFLLQKEEGLFFISFNFSSCTSLGSQTLQNQAARVVFKAFFFSLHLPKRQSEESLRWGKEKMRQNKRNGWGWQCHRAGKGEILKKIDGKKLNGSVGEWKVC